MSSSFDQEREAPEFESVSSLAENLVYRLPGCADLMIRKTLQSIYREFCQRSCALVSKKVHRFDEDGDSCVCIMPMNDDFEVDVVKSVYIGRRRLEQGRHFMVCDNRVVFPHRYTNVDVVVECVEIPKIGSENAPKWFLARYGEAICSGVMYRLTSMLNKPWSDMNQSYLEGKNYNDMCNSVRLEYYCGGKFSNAACRADGAGGLI